MELLIPSFVVVIPSILFSIFGLIISGLLESKYVSRGTIIANIFFLWQILLPTNPTDSSIILYLNISAVFLIMALYSFLSGYIPQIEYQPLKPIVYELSYGFYSSKTALGFAIASILNSGFGVAIIISVIIWFLSVKYLKHNPPFTS